MELWMEFLWNWNFYDWTFMNGVSMEFRWNFYGNLWMFDRNLWMFLLADMEFHRIEPAQKKSSINIAKSQPITHNPKLFVQAVGQTPTSCGSEVAMTQWSSFSWWDGAKKTALSAYSSYTSNSPTLIMLVIWWCPAAIFSSAEYEVYKII